MALIPGTSLGPYQIDVPLGAGGMGEVYKATDTRLDRTVAIKAAGTRIGGPAGGYISRCKLPRVSPWLAAVSLSGLLVLAGFSFQPSLAQVSATVVLTGARVIDGTGRAPLEQATLLISSGRIQAVGAASEVPIPDGAARVDVSGKTIMPGLINAHAHLNDGDETLSLYDQLLAQLRLYAEYGVTTIHTLGDDGVESVRVRDEQARGDTLDRARLYVSGPNVVAETVAEARQGVDRVAELRVNIIKTRLDATPNDMAPEVYRALIDQAHQRGLRVVAHLVALDDAKGLVDAGVDVIAHSVRDQDVDAELIAKLTRLDVGYIPTLTRNLAVFLYETTPAFFSDAFFLRGADAYRADMEQIQDPALHEQVRTSEQAQVAKKTLQQAKRNLKLLADGGVTIAMGTDSGTQLGRWQGYFEHVELELMVEAGLTPMQALVAATGDGARVMHLDELGTLEPGKWADLVVLNANPLADIKNTRQIDSVWVAGRRLAVGN